MAHSRHDTQTKAQPRFASIAQLLMSTKRTPCVAPAVAGGCNLQLQQADTEETQQDLCSRRPTPTQDFYSALTPIVCLFF